MMEYVLQTKNLRKKYRDFEALRGLDMHVPQGSIYGFVGKNGAGKTTLFPAGLRAAGTYIGRIFALWEEQQTEGYHPIQKANGGCGGDSFYLPGDDGRGQSETAVPYLRAALF